jgi:MFS family permease
MDIEQRTIKKAVWRLMPLLLLFVLTCYVDRVNLAYAAPGMMKHFGFTATVYGFGAGLFFIPYTLLEIPSNIILAKVGARVWFCRIMIGWGLISGAQAFIQGEYSFYTFRVLLAAAEAGCYPGVMYFISRWFPAEYRARIIGIVIIALPLSNVVGGPLSGPLLNLGGRLGLMGWQWLFLAEAVPAIVLGLVFLAILPSRPEEAKWLDPEERAWLTERLAAEKRGADVGHHRGTWQAMTNPMVIALGLICACAVTSNWGLSFFLPQILKGFGLNNVQTGFVAAIPFAVGAFGCYIWGKHSDYTKERPLHVAAALIIAGGFIGFSTLFTSPLMQMIMLSIAGFGMFAYIGPFWAMSTARLSGAGPAAAAAALAAINTIASVAGFVTPYAFGYIKDVTNSFTGGFLMITAVSFIGMVIVLVIRHSVGVTMVARKSRVGAD